MTSHDPSLTLDTVKYRGSEIGPSTQSRSLSAPITIHELAESRAAEMGSDNTRDAFRGDWSTWVAYCEMAHREGFADAPTPQTVDPRALLVFANWLADGPMMPDETRRKPAAPESIRRRLTGVLAGWKTLGVDYPRGVTEAARAWVDHHEAALIEARKPTGRGKAAPLTIKDLQLIVEATPPGLAGARDIALILLDFSIAGRRSEVSFLDVEDISAAERGLDVHVRRSKTGHREVAVLYGQNPSTCPVRAWRRWQEVSEISEGAAFRAVDRHGNVGARLSGAAVSDVIARASKRAGIGKRTGHSARRGLATVARDRGRKVEQIADQGGWKRGSAALQGYIDSVDRWNDNVMIGLGL